MRLLGDKMDLIIKLLGKSDEISEYNWTPELSKKMNALADKLEKECKKEWDKAPIDQKFDENKCE